ncbi:hypothetical protein B0T24DRAFT_261649 [Lasiosphaeria ovina]|uniref:Uncharacterized protein n=1 Tax=Lasiosphaeria ovina TaxID=92902 RepID=A0AAE0KBG7_9PEZI|nr:hypothetical protein B0T24DRAFT_261649 [Lasiosphaeria ovina]
MGKVYICNVKQFNAFSEFDYQKEAKTSFSIAGKNEVTEWKHFSLTRASSGHACLNKAWRSEGGLSRGSGTQNHSPIQLCCDMRACVTRARSFWSMTDWLLALAVPFIVIWSLLFQFESRGIFLEILDAETCTIRIYNTWAYILPAKFGRPMRLYTAVQMLNM